MNASQTAILVLSLITIVCLPVLQSEIHEFPNFKAHFENAGVTGTFVIYDPTKDSTFVHNKTRSNQRFRPASSFKVANAIIALDTGVVRNIEEVIPYGGTREYFKNWEQDMTIDQAMRVSNVAVFHTIARRIGLEKYRDTLEAYGYGNADPGMSIDNRFWLNGPLEISALEQVEFFRKVTAAELPADANAIAWTKEMILYEETQSYRIYAKTGWVGPDDPQIGWWVGWVEYDDFTYPFALNIDIRKDEDAPKRLTIGKACMRDLLGLE